jgi:hypothetical protein
VDIESRHGFTGFVKGATASAEIHAWPAIASSLHLRRSDENGVPRYVLSAAETSISGEYFSAELIPLFRECVRLSSPAGAES